MRDIFWCSGPNMQPAGCRCRRLDAAAGRGATALKHLDKRLARARQGPFCRAKRPILRCGTGCLGCPNGLFGSPRRSRLQAAVSQRIAQGGPRQQQNLQNRPAMATRRARRAAAGKSMKKAYSRCIFHVFSLPFAFNLLHLHTGELRRPPRPAKRKPRTDKP